MSEQYVSGNWMVRAGSEDEFIKRWRAFTGWSAEEMPGARSFLLLRDAANPSHFVSLGNWDDEASMSAWRNSSGFAERFPPVRELCEDFRGNDYKVAAHVGSHAISY